MHGVPTISLSLSLSDFIPAPEKLLRTPTGGLLAGVLGLYALRKTSNALSNLSLNNWQSAKPFIPENELAVVTGGSSGIGRRIVEDLTSRGVRVVVLDVQEPGYILPPKATYLKTDITSPTSLSTSATTIRTNYGHPTILINNAGVFFNGTILDQPLAEIQSTFNVNILAHFITAKEFLPAMIERNHGHVVVIASMAGHLCLGEMVDYACAKAGAVAFYEGVSQELRRWYGAEKVRTSLILPMWVDTPMIDNFKRAGDIFGQPILHPRQISNAIVNQIFAQQSGQLILPSYASIISYIRAAPIWVQEAGRNFGSSIIKRVRDEVWAKE